MKPAGEMVRDCAALVSIRILYKKEGVHLLELEFFATEMTVELDGTFLGGALELATTVGTPVELQGRLRRRLVTFYGF